MYRQAPAGMGEFFAYTPPGGTQGMGEYLQAAAGMQGLGAYTSVSVSANDAGAKDRAMLVRLVQWMRNPRDPALQSALETQYTYWWKNSRGEAPSADALDRALDQAFQVWLVNKGAYHRINALSAAAASWIANRSVAGLGEFFAYTPPGMNGALVNWAHQEEAEHPGIFGMGEYFGANGLGAMTEQETRDYAIGAGAGAVVGAVAAMLLKKRKVVGAGIGAALGLTYAYGANAGWFAFGGAGG